MKRVMHGGLAVVLAAIMPLANVAAMSDMDYEKSIGQISGADTINRVVEATSDGGYAVGGQTAACYRYETQSHLKAGVSDGGNQNGELVDTQECIDHAGELNDLPIIVFSPFDNPISTAGTQTNQGVGGQILMPHQVTLTLLKRAA